MTRDTIKLLFHYNQKENAFDGIDVWVEDPDGFVAQSTFPTGEKIELEEFIRVLRRLSDSLAKGETER